MSSNEKEPVFQYTLHKKMWNILAENPGMTKYEALNKFFTDEEWQAFRESDCTACTYVSMLSYVDTDHCYRCPLDAEGIQVDPLMDMSGQCFKGLYGAWDLTTDLLNWEGDIASWIQELGDYDSYEISIIVDNLGQDYNEEKIKELCSKYARMIANLPVKPGVKYI